MANKLIRFNLLFMLLLGCVFISQSTAFAATPTKPNFSAFKDVKQKKKAFFEYVRPSVAKQNTRTAEERKKLLTIENAFKKSTINASQQKYIDKLAADYRYELPKQGVNQAWFNEMRTRINLIPEALILSQAANESAWGTSRFATKGNNYFGQWCYKAGCGLKPLKRKKGATHEVAKFDSVDSSVRAYFMNINRNGAYKELRAIRRKLADNGDDITTPKAATKLTKGLSRYSERGQAYVKELQSMIRHNKSYWQ